MKLAFFVLQQLLAVGSASVVGFLLSPFPYLKMKWLKLILPAVISFANEYLECLEKLDFSDHEAYFTVQYAKDNYIAQLHRINNMKE